MSVEQGRNESSIPSVRYMSTSEAYDLWSEVYDIDGNFLQALDTIEMRSLLPQAVSALQVDTKPWKAIDLGCGTGRNTFGLLEIQDVNEVVALDLSPKMLGIAKQRLDTAMSKLPARKTIYMDAYDMISAPAPPEPATDGDLVISTLVLEHVPLDIYFRTISQMLKVGGLLLLTNMHSEMGSISQAGFVDPKTGEKIRPQSFAHTISDVLVSAANHGMEIVGKVKEVKVDEDLASKVGDRGKKWVAITVWFGGVWRKVS